MKKLMQTIGKIFYSLLLGTLIVVAVATFISTIDIPGNYRLLSVQSGSMEPAIKTGSIVIVKPVDTYKIGDIITFTTNPKNRKTSVTHRVQDMKEENGKQMFITKGDANDAPDQTAIPKEQIFGKVLFFVPYVGFPISYAKTLQGLVILVVIPATIIIYSELVNIKSELSRMITAWKKKRTHPDDEVKKE